MCSCYIHMFKPEALMRWYLEVAPWFWMPQSPKLRKMNDCCLSHSVCGILLSQPELTKTPMNDILPQINELLQTLSRINTKKTPQYQRKPDKLQSSHTKKEILFSKEKPKIENWPLNRKIRRQYNYTLLIKENQHQMEFYKCPLKIKLF